MKSSLCLWLISYFLSLVFLLIFALGLASGLAFAQTTESATTTTGGIWTDSTTWTCTPALSPCIPNNTASDVFNVAIDNASVRILSSLSTPTTIEVNALSVASGSLELQGVYDVDTTLNVDGPFTTSGTGGVSLLGGESGAAVLNAGGTAPTVLTGSLSLTGGYAPFEGDAVLNYQGGGEITQIGDGGSNPGSVMLTGNGAFVESGGISGNSALSALATIASNGNLTLNAANITTGPLTNNGAIFDGGELEIGALTNSGSVSVAPADFDEPPGAEIDIGGTLFNSGSVSVLGSSSPMEYFGDAEVHGDVVNSGVIETTFDASMSVAGSITNAGTMSIGGGGGNPIPGILSIGGNLTNSGTVDADESTVSVAGTFDNTGGTLNLDGGGAGYPATLTAGGVAPSTLTGTFNLSGAGYGVVLSYEGGGGIAQIGDGGANGGSVTLVGSNAFIEVGGVSGNSALSTLTTVASNGALNLEDGATVTTSGALTNSGAVYVDASSTLTATGGYTQIAGTTEMDGTLIAEGGVNINGGTLSGSGTIDGNVVNNAVVSPGDPATLTVVGDYSQGAGGTLVIDISGATDYSILDVTGTLTLNGTVDFDLLDGYVPGPGTEFTFLDAGYVSGDFTSLEFTGGACSGCTFDLATLSLDTGSDPPAPAPEPSSLVLFGTGALGLGLLVRPRRRPHAVL